MIGEAFTILFARQLSVDTIHEDVHLQETASHEIDGVRKEKERLTAASIIDIFQAAQRLYDPNHECYPHQA